MLTTTLARGAAAVLLALTATTVTAAPALAEGGHDRDAKRTYTITQTWDVPKGSTDFQWMECQIGQDKRIGKSLRTRGGASARWTGSGDNGVRVSYWSNRKAGTVTASITCQRPKGAQPR